MIETDAASRIMFARRAAFAALFAATMAASLFLAAMALSPGGLGAFDVAVLVLFAITLPWMVAGFCNALIGFIIMRFAADPVAAVLPAVRLTREDDPVRFSTAILLCVRNESPARTIRNLEPMLEGLCASGYADRFHLYILSDTDAAELATTEETTFSELTTAWQDRIAISYRRRSLNSGFKAGNIRDFCERWGNHHEFAVTLDADSFMPSDAIIRLVRIMQVDPKLGILQGLIVGLPSTSLFARIFQFGMRLGMRSYTIGSAWWQGDCGPYWGHNAILRLKPFIEHCQLPLLMKDGKSERQILSHDQIEAAMMRASGYHVRVVPREDLGWEENPPTLLEFVRRDLRWCQGNMQYWRLITLPNLAPVSRYQLVLAILMFVGSPAWVALLGLATAALVLCKVPADIMRSDFGYLLFVWVLLMWFSPKIAGALDVMLAPNERRAFGGAGQFAVNFAIEMVYSIALCPILWISHTNFLFGRLFNRGINWMGQVRHDHVVPFRSAMRNLWPQTVVGWLALGCVAIFQPWALPYILLLAGGPAFAAPFATLTASPMLGILATRIGVGRLPEETTAPEDLLELALPAINSDSRPPLTNTV